MKILNEKKAIEKMNALASDGKAFIFVISYDKTQAIVEDLNEIDTEEMLYCFNGVTNVPSQDDTIPSRCLRDSFEMRAYLF